MKVHLIGKKKNTTKDGSRNYYVLNLLVPYRDVVRDGFYCKQVFVSDSPEFASLNRYNVAIDVETDINGNVISAKYVTEGGK